MTKKSYARQQRDMLAKELEDNKCWDDLNQIYETARIMLGQHAAIHTLAMDPRLQACLENPSSTASSIKILARDLLALNEDLKTIYAKHAGKTGGSQNADDVMMSITIGQEYAILSERHISVVQPIAFKILEDFQYAEKKLATTIAVGAKLAERSSDDIIDVDVSQQ